MVELYVLSAGLGLIGFSSYFYFKREGELKTLAKISKEQQIKFLVYGDLNKKNEKQLSKFLPALKKILSDSEAVSKEVELKISSNDTSLKCQIRFVAGSPIGQLVENNGNDPLLKGLKDLTKVIENKDLELVLTDFFSGYGGVGYSEISFEIPA